MAKQLRLNLDKGTYGGRRRGSGRKRFHSRGVAHRKREIVTCRTPLHINFRFRKSIRNKEALRLLKKSIVNARAHGLKILHYSLQCNHVHLIVEATDNDLLTKGMRSLTITFAKGLKQGRIQLQRYHMHVLRTLRETRNAIQYVLFNQQKHENGTCSTIDDYSSILELESAWELIRRYAQKMKILLRIKRGEDFELDRGGSFLARRGLGQLLT